MFHIRINNGHLMSDEEFQLAVEMILPHADGKVFTGHVDGEKGAISAYIPGEIEARALAFDIETTVPFNVEVTEA